jgi:YVTN family beta-propeller protein
MTRFFAALVGSIAIVSGAPSSAQNAYIPNAHDNTVSVIDTATNTVVGLPIPVGDFPFWRGGQSRRQQGLCREHGLWHAQEHCVGDRYVIATGDQHSVATANSSTVSVIDTATNTVVGTIPVFSPFGEAVAPDGSKVYVTSGSGVAVIDPTTNTVTATIPVGYIRPYGVAITPDGRKVYVVIEATGLFPVPGSVSVIDTATNMVVGSPIQVGTDPTGVAITPDGSTVYVTNEADKYCICDRHRDQHGGRRPSSRQRPVRIWRVHPAEICWDAWGHQLLWKEYLGVRALNAAAIALGFPTLQGLQTAVNAYCGE